MHANIAKRNTTKTGHRFDRCFKGGMLLAILAAAVGCNDSTNPTGVGEQGVGGKTNTNSNSTAAGGSSQTTNTSGASQAKGGATGVGGTSSQGGSGGTGANATATTGGASAAASAGGSKASGGSKAAGGSVAAGGSKAASGGATVSSAGSKAVGGTVAASGGNPAGGAGPTGGKAGGGNTPAAGGAATGGATSATGGVGVAGGANPSKGGGTSSSQSGGENSGADCNATGAPLLSAQNKKLPDPFSMHDGTRISTKAQWPCRRAEMKADIEKYEIGPKPDPSTATVEASLSGSDLSVKVTTSSGSLTIKSAVSGSGSCVVIAMDSDLGLVSGCTKITFSTADVIPYNNGSGSQSKSDPFYKLYPDLWGKIGNYTAWSWGVSRMIDGLEQVKDQLKIDPTKVTTHGCSYAGKMALFAGALDERVALTVAEESGGGGITSWRLSQDFTTRTGTNVEKIDNTNFAWFMSSMKSLDPYKLPHDHHELIAMVAPRAIIILGNDDYDWLGDESGYKSTMAAVEVFKALGVADHIGYDFTSGHGHCQAPATQKNSINAFVDHFLKDKTSTSTAIAIKPPKSGFDLDYSKAIDWSTPTLN
jgi:hypothetical protein